MGGMSLEDWFSGLGAVWFPARRTVRWECLGWLEIY